MKQGWLLIALGLVAGKGAARDLAQSLRETLRVRRSPAKIAQVVNVNGGHKLSPDLRATNQEIQHEDCSYRR